MIWIVEVPIIVFIIIGMMVGSLQLGAVLRTIGWILTGITAVVAIPLFNPKVKDKETWVALIWLLIINALVCLFLGYLMGDLNLFEFLFGTGWF